MSGKRMRIERTSREIIQNKLLADLTDNDDKVAIILNEKDLRFLIKCLESYTISFPPDHERRKQDLCYGLKRLLEGAFPPRGRRGG